MKVTLCGSTRFINSFNEWNLRLTKAGHIVYSVCAVTSSAAEPGDSELKLVLDAVHIAKIEESDAIFVITTDHKNVDEGRTLAPYVGESTAREIYYAQLRGKLILGDGGLRETNDMPMMHATVTPTPLRREQPLSTWMRLPGRAK